MDLPTYFADFLLRIRPSGEMRDTFKQAHTKLRQLLLKDTRLADIIIGTFLQGSYRRATAICPVDGKRSDIDIAIVTKFNKREYDPKQALSEFKPFLQQHYGGAWGSNSRSLHVTDADLDVDLDLVITSAPAESEVGMLSKQICVSASTSKEHGSEARTLWKLSPLEIPDQVADRWQQTHPLAQIAWTIDKNRKTRGHYVNIVKALKWWRRTTTGFPVQPKSYPFEHFIGFCCPDGVSTIAMGIAQTLETIVRRFEGTARSGEIPFLPGHGLPSQNVFAKVAVLDFQQFLDHVKQASDLANHALKAPTVAESARRWRVLFGDAFPSEGSGQPAEYRSAAVNASARRVR